MTRARSLSLLTLPLLVFAACNGSYVDEPSALADAGGDASEAGADGAGGLADGGAPADAADPAPADGGDAGVDAGPPTLAVADVSLRDGIDTQVSVVVTREGGAPLEVTLEGLPALVSATPAKVTLGAADTVATFTLSRGVGVASGEVTVTARAAPPAAPSGGVTKDFRLTVVAGGALDSSFGTGGIVTVPGASWTTLGPDGSLYLAHSGSAGASVERRAPNGELDTNYGVGGFAMAPKSIPQISVDDVLLGPQGESVVIGHEAGDSALLLLRFSPAGVFDATFGGGGVVTIPAPASEVVRFRAVTVGTGGEVLVALTFFGTSTGTPKLIKLLATGQPDPSFVDRTPASIEDYETVTMLPGGDVLAGVRNGDAVGLVRLGTNTLTPAPTTWGHPFAALFNAAVAADGGVFAAGFVSAYDLRGSSFAVVRYDASLGLVSPATSAWSRRLGSEPLRSDSFYKGHIDARQRFVTVGQSDYRTLVVGRYTKGGFDPGFGVDGLASVFTVPTDSRVFGVNVVTLPSGAIVVSAMVDAPTTWTARIVRLHP